MFTDVFLFVGTERKISIFQMKFVEEGLIRFHNFLQLFASFWIKFTLMSLKTPNIFVRVSNEFCFTVLCSKPEKCKFHISSILS